MTRFPFFICSLTSILLCTVQTLYAAAPSWTHLYPSGARQGESLTVEAGGKFSSWPPRLWNDRSGITIKPSKDKNKLEITVDSTASPGVYFFRAYNDEGVSAPRPFVVGTLPETIEQEPNNDYRKPQLLSESTVVNGRLSSSGDVDTFAVKLAAGQTVVASMTANEVLGSPMDGILEVTSEKGFRLKYNHDTKHLDPQIVFTAPQAGTYLIRTFAFPAQPNQSINFSSSPKYVYRLTVTTGGFVDHVFPLTASRQTPTEVEMRGWNIPQGARFLQILPKSSSTDPVTLHHPLLANTIPVQSEPHEVTVETFANDEKQPQRINVPVIISGSISQPREEDWYQFSGKKGQQVRFEAESWDIGFPLDPMLRLVDSLGKRLQQVDDPKRGIRDAVLTQTLPADGEYRLMIRDLHRHGGFRYVYRLRASSPQPDFSVNLAADAFVLSAEKPLEIPVTIDRKNKFDSELEISAVDLPAGVTSTVVKSPGKGKEAKSVKLKLTTDLQTPISGTFRIVAKTTGESAMTRYADAPLTGLKAKTERFWLTVTKTK